MADEIVAPSAEVAAPVVAAPAVETVVAPVVAPVVVPAAAPEIAPAVETKVEAKAPEVKTEPTVLGSEEPKPPTPVDGAAKQPEGEKKEEVSQSDEPASLPSFDPWVFPEGVVADTAKVEAFNKMFGQFEVSTKVDHAEMQKLGQQLIDFNISQMKELHEQVNKQAQDYWDNKSQEWLEQFKKDPEIGGNRQDTTTRAAREFIRRHGGTEEQQKEIRDLMETTRLGNNPAMIRLLANANTAKSEGKPVPATTPPAPKLSRKQKFYGNKS